MADKPNVPEDRDDTEIAKVSAPSGAIFVTTLVTVVTLVLWLGTYILNVLRS